MIKDFRGCAPGKVHERTLTPSDDLNELLREERQRRLVREHDAAMVNDDFANDTLVSDQATETTGRVFRTAKDIADAMFESRRPHPMRDDE